MRAGVPLTSPAGTGRCHVALSTAAQLCHLLPNVAALKIFVLKCLSETLQGELISISVYTSVISEFVHFRINLIFHFDKMTLGLRFPLLCDSVFP